MKIIQSEVLTPTEQKVYQDFMLYYLPKLVVKYNKDVIDKGIFAKKLWGVWMEANCNPFKHNYWEQDDFVKAFAKYTSDLQFFKIPEADRHSHKEMSDIVNFNEKLQHIRGDRKAYFPDNFFIRKYHNELGNYFKLPSGDMTVRKPATQLINFWKVIIASKDEVITHLKQIVADINKNKNQIIKYLNENTTNDFTDVEQTLFLALNDGKKVTDASFAKYGIDYPVIMLKHLGIIEPGIAHMQFKDLRPQLNKFLKQEQFNLNYDLVYNNILLEAKYDITLADKFLTEKMRKHYKKFLNYNYQPDNDYQSKYHLLRDLLVELDDENILDDHFNDISEMEGGSANILIRQIEHPSFYLFTDKDDKQALLDYMYFKMFDPKTVLAKYQNIIENSIQLEWVFHDANIAKFNDNKDEIYEKMIKYFKYVKTGQLDSEITTQDLYDYPKRFLAHLGLLSTNNIKTNLLNLTDAYKNIDWKQLFNQSWLSYRQDLSNYHQKLQLEKELEKQKEKNKRKKKPQPEYTL